MRVLHVTNAYPYPEVPEYGVFVKEQIDALNRSGIACDVMFVNGRAEGKGAYFKAVGELRRLAPAYDIIHCHHLFSSFIAALARVRPPVVLSFQNEWPREMPIGNRQVQVAGCSFGAWYADRVIFKSPIPARFRGQDKFVHLPNGVNYDAFTITSKPAAREQLGLDPQAAYVLFVSSKDQFRPQKRYDRFRETLEIVRARNPGMDLRELVMVNQERSKVGAFFNAADVHLLCSDFEGSPNSVKEALCTGLAVVATPVGNTPEMLASVPGCALSAGFDASELAGLVERALARSVARKTIREAFVAQGLSQEAMTARLGELYSSLVQDCPTRRPIAGNA
jgi:glycosyltransferase involved in cell wall biosynthesis